MVIDLLLAVFLLLLLVRGWMRGFVREAIAIGALVAGMVLAFRLAPLTGPIVVRLTGMSPEMGRIVGGSLTFLAVAIGAALASYLIRGTVRIVPGLTTINRVGGAALGAAYAVIMATLVTSLLAAVSLPEAVASQLEDSRIVTEVTDPAGRVQPLMSAVAGDRVVQTAIALRRIAGTTRVVAAPSAVAVLPPAADEVLRPEGSAARALFEAANEARVEAGVDPVAWSDELAVVAIGRAGSVYRSGDLSAPTDVADRLATAAIPYAVVGENTSLAPTVSGVHEAFVASAPHRDRLVDERFRRVGVGVVAGPYGLMAVQVFTG